MLARAKGFSEYAVIWREAMRNAVLPTLTLVGRAVHLPDRRHGDRRAAVLLRGLGNLAIDAVINRDLPLIQGIVLLFSVLFIAINLAVDLTYACAEPEAAAWVGRPLRLWLWPGGWLALLALAALFAPLIAPHDPLAQDMFLGRLPPFWVDGAEPGYLLGTDSARPRRAVAA
jgi:hypothetical protein